MSDYTVLRLEVDSDVVRRAAGVVPGVEVPEASEVSEGRFGPVTPFPGESDDDATDDTVETPGRGGQIRSLVGEYGLLAAGVALIGAGVATAGLWWYRRRTRDDEPEFDYEGAETESWGDTPPPGKSRRAADRLDRGVSGREPVPNPDGVPGDERGVDDAVEDVAADDRETDDTTTADQVTGETTTTTELAGTESTAGEDSGEADAAASETDVAADEDTDDGPAEVVDEATETPLDDTTDVDEASEGDDTDERQRPEQLLAGENGSVDRAPLFGVAFLALTGALVRWLRGDRAYSND